MPKATALILEDSPTQAMIIARMIEAQGWSTIHCLTVREALDSLKLISFQALFLDVFVGIHNSISHVEQFRKLSPDTPLTLMTAGAGHEALEKTLRQARAARADFVLRKPFSESDVKHILDSSSRDSELGERRKHVLVIDDSKTVRSFATGALDFNGYRASNTESMEEALMNIDIAHVDLVLVDIFMPGMGGLEGIRAIKSAWPQVKIIAMSAGMENFISEDDALNAARMIGADAQIKKPFTPENLAYLVGAVLGQSVLLGSARA
jgi:CheY-like chemotaxis protein